MAEMLHELHKTCKSSSLTQGCLICWRLVLSPGAAVGCCARFRPLSPSARTEARGCTLNRRTAASLLAHGPAAGPGGHDTVRGMLMCMRYPMAPQFPCAPSGSERHCPTLGATGTWLVWFLSAMGHSCRSCSAPRGFQPTGITVLGSTLSTHSSAHGKPHLGVFYSTQSVQTRSGTALPSSTAQALYKCFMFCFCCLK